jgi:hypothetical protein
LLLLAAAFCCLLLLAAACCLLLLAAACCLLLLNNTDANRGMGGQANASFCCEIYISSP